MNGSGNLAATSPERAERATMASYAHLSKSELQQVFNLLDVWMKIHADSLGIAPEFRGAHNFWMDAIQKEIRTIRGW